MARTFTGGQRATMGGPTFWIYAWLYILDTDGNWRDFTSLSGFDWFDSFTWTEDIDVPVGQGTITLRREVGGLSLAPTVAASPLNKNLAGAYVPLLSTGREFKIVVASVPFGTARSAVLTADLIELARGKIDRVDWSADPIKLTVRDDGAWLQNAFIQNLTNYGTGVGTPIETVMQQIIDDNSVKGGATIVTPSSPGFMVTPFTQQRVTVSSADNTLALQIGWDLRYRYNATNVSELQFIEPPRTKTISDYSIGPTEYTDVQQITVDDANVRNVIRVVFANSATGGVGTVVASNAASIAEFGVRFYEITEQSSSNITTVQEATDLANAIVSDLGAPKADHAITTFLLWIVQLYDLITFTANGLHYDQDQQMGVIGFTHTLQNGTGTTVIRVRGQLAGAYQKWINRFGITTVQLFPPPQPRFVVTASGSPDGGVTQDGQVFIEVDFEPNTDTVFIYSSTGPTQDVAVPDESDNLRAFIIQRPAGTGVAQPFYTTTVQIATTNGWWRCVKCFGVGPSFNNVPGARSVPFIETIQAGLPNTTQAGLPSFQTFTVVRDADGVTADMVWAIDLSAAPADAIIVITRNGQVISGDGLSQGTEAFSDPQAPTTSDTAYAIYLFAEGVTGPKATATLAATGTVIGVGVSAAPVFNNGTPGYVSQLSTIPAQRQVVVGWTCADTLADQIVLQVSADAATWATVYDSGVVGAGDPLIAAGFAYTTRVAREYLRLVTFVGGVQKLASANALFIPIAPASFGGIIILGLSVPYASYDIGLGPKVELSWTNPFTTGAHTIVQTAHSRGGPWTTVVTIVGAAASGQYSDGADYATALFFRVAILDGGGASLGASTGVPWYPLPYTGFSAGTYTP